MSGAANFYASGEGKTTISATATGARGRHETGRPSGCSSTSSRHTRPKIARTARGLDVALRRRIEGRQDPRLLAGVPAAHDVPRHRDGRHRASPDVPPARGSGDDLRDHARQRQACPGPGLGVRLRVLGWTRPARTRPTCSTIKATPSSQRPPRGSRRTARTASWVAGVRSRPATSGIWGGSLYGKAQGGCWRRRGGGLRCGGVGVARDLGVR